MQHGCGVAVVWLFVLFWIRPAKAKTAAPFPFSQPVGQSGPTLQPPRSSALHSSVAWAGASACSLVEADGQADSSEDGGAAEMTTAADSAREKRADALREMLQLHAHANGKCRGTMQMGG